MRLPIFLLVGCVVASGCSGSGDSIAATAMQPTEVSVNVTDGRSFSPNVVTVSPGDRVVWTNLDSVAHGVKSGAGPNSSGTYSAGIAPGQKYTWRVPGTLRQGTDLAYTCPFDQHMQGIIHIK